MASMTSLHAVRYERLRQTHPRLGKAAHDAWDKANPALDSLCCPTCAERYRQPLAVEWDGPDPDLSRGMFGSRMVIAPVRLPYITCPRDHRWTIAYITRQEGQPDRVSFGHYIGGGWEMAA